MPNTQKHELKVQTTAGPATLALSQTGRIFTVEYFEVEKNPEGSLGFRVKGPGVVNLDTASSAWDCFGISTKVQYGNVLLGNIEMRANSLEELTHALKQVKLTTFNHEDV